MVRDPLKPPLRCAIRTSTGSAGLFQVVPKDTRCVRHSAAEILFVSISDSTRAPTPPKPAFNLVSFRQDLVFVFLAAATALDLGHNFPVGARGAGVGDPEIFPPCAAIREQGVSQLCWHGGE